MPTIQILRSTVAKQSLEQSSKLADRFKRALTAGRYEIEKIEPANQQHLRVTFPKPLLAADEKTSYQTWLLWGDDVQAEGAIAVSLEAPRPPSNPTEINWRDNSCRISKYFTVGEVIQYDRRRIPQPDSPELRNVLRMAQELDKIREEWGSGIGVTSWHRPYEINLAVGGVPNSTHVQGLGVDIYAVNDREEEFESFLAKNWGGAIGLGVASGRRFTHLDLRGGGWRRGAGEIRWFY